MDSYKQLHDQMYPEGTEKVYSYLEARKGAAYDNSVFFGLQYFLKEWLEGVVLTKEMVDEAEPIMKEHFKFNGNVWSREKWDHIVNVHGGRLPVVMKAVPEGTKLPVNNILMSVENTDPKCFWLTNALETLLQNVWYPITVCTRSNFIVTEIRKFFKDTVDDEIAWLSAFYLHDFGQRATTTPEAAGLGGMAHLVNSQGTDTDMAIMFAMNYYNAKVEGLAYSVPASEHSIATSLGKDGEFEVTKRLIEKYPTGILSVVSDSYDIVNAIKVYCNELKPLILQRDGKFVVRPDSPRFAGDTAADQVLWIVQELEQGFGTTVNAKGFKVLNPKVGVIYGDGLTEVDIVAVMAKLKTYGYSAQNCVFGCGGYLLQRLNRDTMRMAFKSSAQQRNGVWHDICKTPTDLTKISKKGKLKLIRVEGSHGTAFTTVGEDQPGKDELVTVFENGKLLVEYTFDEVRNRAK